MSEGVKLSIVPESAAPQPEQPSKKLTVGERLALARSSQELSVDQIAGQLKWSTRQISEIEAGNYSVFPDMLTVRGFVRTYAKTLKIDPVPLIEELTSEFEKLPARPIDRPNLDTPFPAGRMPWRHSNDSQKMIAGSFLIFLCLVAVFVYRVEILRLVQHIVPGKTGNVVELAGSAPGTQAPDANAGKSKPAESSSFSVVAPKVEAVPGTAAGLVQASSGTSEPTATAPEPAAKKAGIKSDDAGVVRDAQIEQQKPQLSVDGALVLRFKQDSWIQLRRLDGSVVTSRLYRAGTEEVIGVNEPLKMVIGNAPGVEVTLRGQHLILPAQAGSNVVNLSIK